MECPFCDQEVEDDEIRCPECGNPLKEGVNGDKSLDMPKDLEGLFEDLFEEDEEDEGEKDLEDPHVLAASLAQDVLMELSEAKGLGVDGEEAQKFIDMARVAIANKHFKEAISLSQQARTKIAEEKEIQKHKMDTVNRAQEVQGLINNAKELKLYTAEAEAVYLEAKTLMGQKDYTKSLELLDKAVNLLDDAKVYFQVIRVAKEVRDKLAEMSTFGLDISKPEQIFKDAKPHIEGKKFPEALEMLENASGVASKLLLMRQLQQMELYQEDTSHLKKATGVFILEEEDEEEEEEEKGDVKPYKSAYKVEMKQQKKMGKVADEYARLRADFENYRKNTEGRMQQMRDYANMELIGSILDVVDNFERGIKAYKVAEEQDLESFMEGMMKVRKQLVDILKTEKVSPIKCKGKEFDPFLHEAVSTMTSTDLEDNTIIDIVKRGYMYKEKVLRPAKVVINQYPEY